MIVVYTGVDVRCHQGQEYLYPEITLCEILFLVHHGILYILHQLHHVSLQVTVTVTDQVVHHAGEYDTVHVGDAQSHFIQYIVQVVLDITALVLYAGLGVSEFVLLTATSHGYHTGVHHLVSQSAGQDVIGVQEVVLEYIVKLVEIESLHILTEPSFV